MESSDTFALVSPSFFAITVFHMKERVDSDGVVFSSDALTRKLYEQINARKDILLTQTILNGVFCIRLAVGAERTETRHIDAAFKLISDEAHRAITELSVIGVKT